MFVVDTARLGARGVHSFQYEFRFACFVGLTDYDGSRSQPPLARFRPHPQFVALHHLQDSTTSQLV